VAITAGDIDSALTYEVSDPANGVVNGTAPNLVYTPGSNFNGVDTFTVTASDGEFQAVANVTVIVNAVNDAPVALPVSVMTDEDTDVDFTLGATDIDDPDGDLTFDGGEPPSGLLDCTGASCTYTPGADVNGVVQWTFTVTDDSGASNSALVTIAIGTANDAPEIDGPTSVTTDEDVAVAVTLLAHDVDGDSLTYTVLDEPTLGQFQGVAPDLTYTPEEHANGSDSFRFQVEDGNGGVAEATVPITVDPVNDAPVALPLTVDGDEDSTSFFQLDAEDIENDPLTYAVETLPGSGGSVSCSTSGACAYSPPTDFNGSDSFTFRVTDNSGAASTAEVTILVVPDSLVATTMDAHSVLLNLPVFKAHLTRTDTGAPVVGRTVSFVAGGRVQCTAVTDSGGLAQCGGLISSLVAIVGLGYDAVFVGDFDYLPSSDHGPIIANLQIRIRLL
jgi:hypothetical protein